MQFSNFLPSYHNHPNLPERLPLKHRGFIVDRDAAGTLIQIEPLPDEILPHELSGKFTSITIAKRKIDAYFDGEQTQAQ